MQARDIEPLPEAEQLGVRRGSIAQRARMLDSDPANSPRPIPSEMATSVAIARFPDARASPTKLQSKLPNHQCLSEES